MVPPRLARPTRRVLGLAAACVITACGGGGQSPSGAGARAGDREPPTTTAAAPSTTSRSPTPGATVPEGVDAVVVSITDGDTIVVRTAGGTAERVRLIGIDTPETRDPRRGVECFGREAAARTAALLPPGTAVRLERDVELRDRYARLLAYVWRASDGLFVNASLVEGGWAAPYRYPPNVRYAALFSQLGTEAREAGRGLWSACPDAAG